MKKNIKWMSLVLSVALMFSMTACSEDKSSDEKEEKETTVEEVEETEETTEATETEVIETTEETEPEVEETTEETTEETEETTEETEKEPEKPVEQKVQENVDLIKAYHEVHPDSELFIEYYVDVNHNYVEFQVCAPSAAKVNFDFCQDNNFLVNIYPNLEYNACETVGNNLIFVDSFIGETDTGLSYDFGSCITYDVFEKLTIDEIMYGYELEVVDSIPDGSYSVTIVNLKEDGSWCQMKLYGIAGKGVNDGIVSYNPVTYSASFATPTVFYDDPYMGSDITTAYSSVADSSMLDHIDAYLSNNQEYEEIDGCYHIRVSAAVKIENNQITEMIIYPALGGQV
ncbi:MAG: hypothetical protein MJ166_10740 [Clostridia bacterium]|nr:hypothetical protein [Clostridia bacterium]